MGAAHRIVPRSRLRAVPEIPTGDEPTHRYAFDVPSLRASAEELLAFQRLAWSTIVISVTQRCPLRCAHCITQSSPNVGFSLPPTVARRWADELPLLAAEGLRHITFTGGEPVVALRSVSVLAEAAAKLSIRTAVVSSGAWASSRRTAQHLVKQLSAVSHWDIGYDEFHEQWLPWERFALALDALAEAGASFSVRVCEREEGTAGDLVERLRSHCGPDLPIFVQPVKRLGRGSTLRGDRRVRRPRTPCLSTGPLVREDGSVAPCCSGLAYPSVRTDPFDYGSASAEGLGAIWRRWRGDQLLRLMRLVGVEPLLSWLRAAGIDVDLMESEDVCEVCVSLWTKGPDAGRALRARFDTPAVRRKLDELELELFGSVWPAG